MKRFQGLLAVRGGLPMAALLAFVLAGCATPKVDWAGRVGHYTFDQAVLELGPPDKQAKLEDGTIVAEWLTRRGYAYGTPAFGYSPWSSYGPPYPLSVTSYTPDYFLRLTFVPHAMLPSWRKFSR